MNVAITNTSPPASFHPSYNPIANPIGVVINNSGLPILTVRFYDGPQPIYHPFPCR